MVKGPGKKLTSGFFQDVRMGFVEAIQFVTSNGQHPCQAVSKSKMPVACDDIISLITKARSRRGNLYHYNNISQCT